MYILPMSNKFFSTLEYGKAGNKCKALKIWQKYMLILKKYCSVFQIEEITSSNNKLSTTHSTFLLSQDNLTKKIHFLSAPFQCMQYNYRTKWNKIEPRISKSLGTLIRECTFWKNCNQLLWLLLCTAKGAGDTILLAFSGSQKLKKQKKNLIYFAKNFRHFLHSKVIEGDLFLAEHLVRIICQRGMF